MSNPFGKRYLPKLEVLKGLGHVRVALPPQRSGLLPGDDRQVRKGNEQSHNPRQLRLLPDGKKQDQRAGKNGLPRKTHQAVYDSHHAATHLHRDTLQDERVEGRSLLQCPQGRPQGHLPKLPLCRKGRGERDFGDLEERKVRPVRNSYSASVHAQSRDTLNFLQPFRVTKFFF